MLNKLFGSQFRCSYAYASTWGINTSILGAILFISCNCYGQPIRDTSGKVKLGGEIIKSKWTDATKAHYDELIIRPTYDTVKVIMLACDTTSFCNFTHAIAAFNDHGKEYDVAKTKNHIPYVYWLFGYKVYHNGQYKLDGEVPCDYLDENKKPLSKNIIVWLSK